MPPLPPASRPIGQYGQYFQPAYDQYQTNLGAAMVPGVGYIPGPNWQHSPLTMYSSAASAHITPVHAMTGQFVPSSSGTIPSVSHNQAMHTSLPLASSVSAPPSIDGSMPAPPSRLSSVAPQTPPGGQIPPQPQFTPWSGTPNVSQPHGMTQSASMLPPPPPPPQMAVPGQLTAESIGRAIADALKVGSPTYGNTATRAELDAKYAKVARELSNEIDHYLDPNPVTRVLAFDGSPSIGAAPRTPEERMTARKLATHQMGSRGAPLFMSQKEISDYEKATGMTIASALRVTEKKVRQSAPMKPMPKSWGQIDAANGPDDSTIEQMHSALDADDDWWIVIAASISGDLVVQIDCDLNLEGRQA